MLIPDDVTVHRFSKLIRMHAKNYVAERRYVPETYPGQLVYFRAGAGVSQSTASPDLRELSLGWSELTARRDINVHVVPGTHASILEEPGVHVLAAYLRDYLDRE
jgi:thioesterase domain-containing protein